MRAKTASFFQHPRWVAALVITMAATIWSISFCWMAGQIGCPFPNFFHTPSILLKFIPNGSPNAFRETSRQVHQPGQTLRHLGVPRSLSPERSEHAHVRKAFSERSLRAKGGREPWQSKQA